MAEERVQRRLAAVLAADVVGYSRLMGEDEEGTLAALKANRAIIDGLISQQHGRIFHTAGDSVIAEFASAVEAVRCAVEIQLALNKANAGVSEDRRFRLRIGVHLGDVMVEGENLLGDGVNIASRLEGLAQPQRPACRIDQRVDLCAQPAAGAAHAAIVRTPLFRAAPC